MKKILWAFLVLSISSYSQTLGGGVIDIDGNQYNSVLIGPSNGIQEWMKENLNVTKYTDGTPIPQVTDPTAWAGLTTGAWCYYNNSTSNGITYGKLYNWYAVLGIYNAASFSNTSLRKKLAPVGWEIPTYSQWSTLVFNLGGDIIAGGKMKESGTLHWNSPNTGATNSSGFTLLGGATRYSNGPFGVLKGNGWAWSSTENFDNNLQAKACGAYYDWAKANFLNSDKKYGMSVRCIKNNALNHQSFNINSLNIYPNPAKEQITIDLVCNLDVIGYNYKIINALGQEVLYGVLNSQQNSIELNNIKGQGIYFVNIYDSSNSLLGTKKIIIQQ